MVKATSHSIRAAAVSCAVGAAATTIGGIAVQAIVQPATAVPDNRWSYPWSSSALVPISILWASLHVLVFYGVLGFARSGIAGTGRSARLGAATALAGTAMLFVGELASIAVRNQFTSDTGATIVGAIFGIAILLTSVGFLAVGIATIRSGNWYGWRRLTPLSAGIASCALLGLNSTKALPTGVAVYGLCLLTLGIALYTQPSPEPDERPVLAVQEQAA
ncbi:MAG: hypothetical protein ACYDA3_07270 [Gaiellaceae bacterium]